MYAYFIYFYGKIYPLSLMLNTLSWNFVVLGTPPLSFSFALSDEVRPHNLCSLSWFYGFSRNPYATELCDSLLLLFKATFGHLHIFSLLYPVPNC